MRKRRRFDHRGGGHCWSLGQRNFDVDILTPLLSRSGGIQTDVVDHWWLWFGWLDYCGDLYEVSGFGSQGALGSRWWDRWRGRYHLSPSRTRDLGERLVQRR